LTPRLRDNESRHIIDQREKDIAMADFVPDPILVIRGDLVGLGPLRRDLATTYQRWMNELRVTRTLAQSRRPMTFEMEMGWLEGALTSDDAVFTLYELSTMRPIGNGGLHDIHIANGTAEFGIAIGEPDVWGKGYGTEATRLILAYAFDVLGLYNVRLSVYANNQRAVRAYERAGFKMVGALRGWQRIGRERCDEIIMDAVADDFPPSHLHAIMHPEMQG
jgi:diamine N-acetyltransferase